MSNEVIGRAPNLVVVASEIVAAYVANNHVAPADLPMLIARVHETIVELAAGGSMATAEGPIEKPTAAQIKKSIAQDGIVSFIDGRSYKTIKRHLTAHGLTPERYRERYGLPSDYPMVCASYSEQRSNLAKANGLGVPGRVAA